MNIIELEIIRFKLYYDILNKLKKILNNILNEKEIKHLLLRYILNRNIFNLQKNNIGDALFIIIKDDNFIADTQLKEDFIYFKINNDKLQKKIHDTIVNGIIYAADYLKKNIINYEDKNIKIIKKNNIDIFEYSSNSLNNIKDKYISIYNNTISIPYYSHIDFKLYDIKYIFCTLFRYKYIFIDAHSSALDYSDYNKDNAIECFSTPFNRHHTLYCSAFPDLETKLGSLGNFFTIEKFPLKNLFINPPFDNTIMHLAIIKALKLLEQNKYNMIFTLPDWPDAEYYNLLYNSKYFKKKVHFKKGDLEFTNFFTGKTYSPCPNVQIYLSNIV
jgi:hypothetical protein